MALGSIGRNKASGCDGIPVELFQILPGTHGDHLSWSPDASVRGRDELEACVLAREEQPLCVDARSPLSHLSMEESAGS